MRLLISLLATMCLLGFLACSHKTTPQAGGNQGSQPVKPEEAEKTKKVAKVKVDRRGQIFLNEKLVSLDELKKAFADLKQAEGTVWYYRENPEGEPPPEAMSVMQAVIDARLPIRLSTKPDYSDAVGPE